MRDRVVAVLRAALDIVLALPTQLLCWTLSWLGLLDAQSEHARPSFTKLVICANVAILAASVLMGTNLSAYQVIAMVAVLSAGFGRDMYRTFTERGNWNLQATSAWSGGTTTTLTGDAAEVIRALRGDPETQADREHEVVP